MTVSHRRSVPAFLGFALAALLIPVLTPVFPPVALLVAVPMGLLTYRFGLVGGVLAVLGIGAIVALPAGPWAGLAYAFNLSPGVGLGVAFKSGWTPKRTLVLAVGLSLFSLGIGWLILRNMSHVDLAGLLEQMLREAGDSTASNTQLAEREKAVLTEIQSAAPAVAILSAVVTGFVGYAVTRWRLVRDGVALPAPAPFSTWRISWPWAWGYIVGVALEIFHPRWLGPVGHQLGLNLEIVFSALFIIDALAALWYVFDELGWGWSRLLAAIVLLQLHPVLVWAGLLDAWFDFRALWKKKLKGL